MKSIKLLALATLCTVAFSCKKNETSSFDAPKDMDSAQIESVANAISHEDHAEDEMLKKAQSSPLTSVAFAETDFNFGKIKKGDKVEHVFEVTNTGDNPLIISNVKPACGCTVPDYTKEPILPGKKGNITIHFDSSNFDGTVYKTVDAYLNVEKAPIRLNFSADITP